MRTLTALALFSFAGFTGLLTASETTPAYRTVPGAEIINDKFEQAEIPGHWRAAKGDWSIVEGAIQGSEKDSDMHAGVLSTKQTLPATLIATADVRFEGSTAMSLVFNGPDGHICRVRVTPKGFFVTGDKDKKIETDNAATIGKCDQTFETGKWYHFTIEITGEEMLVYTDDKHVVYGTDKKIARTKNSLGVTVSKSAIRVDNVSIRNAEPNADWEAKKAALGIK